MIVLYVVLAVVSLIAWIAAFGWMKDEGIFPLQAPVWGDVWRFAVTPLLVFGFLVYGITTKVLDSFCGEV